jgi:hypothetical protein
MAGHDLTCDKALGRLATGSKTEDWISLPTNTGLMLPFVKIRPWVTTEPTAYKRVWVVKGWLPGQMVQLSGMDKYIPYLVQFKLRDGTNQWFYTPLTKNATVEGDSGCPVITEEGILIGFNVAQNLFVQAHSVVRTEPGRSSWIDCHNTFNSAVVETSNLQCAINSLLSEKDMSKVMPNVSLPEIGDRWDTQQTTKQDIANAVESSLSSVLKKGCELPGPVSVWPKAEEWEKAACRLNACIPATVEQIMITPFTKDNIDVPTIIEPPYKPTKDRLGNDIRDVVEGCYVPNVNGEPRPDLIYGTFLFDSEIHGSFVKMLVVRYSRTTGTRITLSGDAIHDAILWWIQIAIDDIAFSASKEAGGKKHSDSIVHRVRALDWIIPAAAFRSRNIISAVKYVESGGTAPFELVTGREVPEQRFNMGILRRYIKLFPIEDVQAFD